MKIKFSQRVQLNDFLMEVKGDFSQIGCLGIYGESGSGKTTFLNAIAGLIPSSGEFSIDDECIQDSSQGISISSHNRNFGMVFQSDYLFPHLSVKENILAARIFNKNLEIKKEWCDCLIERLAIKSLLERRIQGLSGGQRQRVSLARSLMRRPRLLLLDEPMSSLDRVSRNSIIDTLKWIRDDQSLPIILVSHSSYEMKSLAEKIIILREGSVVDSGSPSQLGKWFLE